MQNIAASDNSGGHGLVVISGSTASFTGANNMSGNLLSGVYVTAIGNIDIYYTTASANGQDGFYLQTDGASFLRCGGSSNNGLYGVNAVNNNTLYLYGMGFSGNALGDINVDGGRVYRDDCSSILDQGSYISAQPGIINVYMTNTRGWVVFDCQLNSGTKLILPNGDFVYLPCPIGEAASLQALVEQNLPGALPSGSSYESGISFDLMENEQSIEQVDGLMTISFVIPESISADDLYILFWNGSEWVEVAGASRVGNHLEAQIDYTGTFVLVSK